MNELIYKSREEELLIKSLSNSQLISKEQLLEIKKLYSEEVPYHNFLHALKVAEGVLKLPKETYNIIEIQSLFISALFHDAGHTGTTEDLDEFRSLDMAFQGIIDFEKKYDYA
jgi:HD superfamily phosphodiesterase